MSKIQEALDKMRDNDGDAGHAPSGGRLSYGRMPTRRGRTEIARMDTPTVWSPDELEAHGLIDFSGPNRRAANAFRQMRTALVQRAGDPNFVLAVTGVVDGSGGSFVARNLASAFALDPTKTSVLVDCDLTDRQGAPLALGPPDGPGLTDYLLDEEMAIETILRPTGVPRMRVVPPGTVGETTGEIYTSPRLYDLLAHLRQRYAERFVIVDTPPLLENADARILCQLCDYTLVVVPYGRVSARRVTEAIDIVGEGRLIGTVFNDDPSSPF